jgi:hypothetical protein
MSEQIMRDNLIVLAQAYADATGLSLATVSKRIHGKHCFMVDFIAGRCSTTLTTYFGMVAKLRVLWPKGAAWPQTRTVPKLARVDLTDADRVHRSKKMPKRTGDGRFIRKPKKGGGDAARTR